VAHAYAKYFAAGYRAGILDLVEGEVAGLQILIEGNIPVASGVSSSSALCVCSALVSHTANEGRIKPIPKEEFVQRCISFEREVGTASGGMDQSISILGELHSCLNIEFNPVRGRKVTIPEGCKFVVMNSLVESAKL
jgi:N-acetylgalactosamine kinase